MLPAPAVMQPNASALTVPSDQPEQQTVETAMDIESGDPAAQGPEDDFSELGMPEPDGLVDLQPFGRSMSVLNQVEVDQGPAIDETDEPVVRYVAASAVNVREQPDTSSPILSSVSTGDVVAHIAPTGEWSFVKTSSGKTGYILSSYLSTEFVAKPTPTPTPKPTPKPTAKPTPKPTSAPAPTATGSKLTSAQKQAIIDLATAQLGKRYILGAMSPSRGFDCSGLTAYIYDKLFDIYLPHKASEQAKRGKAVSKSSLEVGDLIFFDWSSPRGVIDHVGIYIGNGVYINASASAGKVIKSTLNLSRDPIPTVRRIVY